MTGRGDGLDGVPGSGPGPGGPAGRLFGVVAVFTEALAVGGAGGAALGMVLGVVEVANQGLAVVGPAPLSAQPEALCQPALEPAGLGVYRDQPPGRQGD